MTPILELVNVIIVVLASTFISSFVTAKLINRIERKKNNRMYTLYVNEIRVANLTAIQCKIFYEDVAYDSSKGIHFDNNIGCAFIHTDIYMTEESIKKSLN